MHTDLYFCDDDESENLGKDAGATVVTIAVFQLGTVVLHNDGAIYLRKLSGPSQSLSGELELCQMQ